MKTLPWNGGLLKRPAATCLVGVPALSVGLPLGLNGELVWRSFVCIRVEKRSRRRQNYFSTDFFDHQAQFVARFRASFRPDSRAIPPDSTRFRTVFTLRPYLFYLGICRILQMKQPDSTACDNPFILLKGKMRRMGVNRRAIWRCTWILTSAYVFVAGTVVS